MDIRWFKCIYGSTSAYVKRLDCFNIGNINYNRRNWTNVKNIWICEFWLVCFQYNSNKNGNLRLRVGTPLLCRRMCIIYTLSSSATCSELKRANQLYHWQEPTLNTEICVFSLFAVGHDHKILHQGTPFKLSFMNIFIRCILQIRVLASHHVEIRNGMHWALAYSSRNSVQNTVDSQV